MGVLSQVQNIHKRLLIRPGTQQQREKGGNDLGEFGGNGDDVAGNESLKRKRLRRKMTEGARH